MVPEDTEAVAAEEGASQKAELDTEEISSPVPREAQKVELDLEDAPFLEEEDEIEEEEEPQEDLLEEEGEKPWYKRRKFIIPASAAVLLLISLAVIYFVFIAGKEEAELVEPDLESQTITEEAAPPVEPEPEPPQEYTVSMRPFWIEQVDQTGKVRFLVCKFAAVTTNEELSLELEQKNTILRDAIFYYLKNKDLTYLSDKENVETLKADLLSVINQYLSTARLETLLIEQYMVK